MQKLCQSAVSGLKYKESIKELGSIKSKLIDFTHRYPFAKVERKDAYHTVMVMPEDELYRYYANIENHKESVAKMLVKRVLSPITKFLIYDVRILYRNC